jgi:hypothetical protein
MKFLSVTELAERCRAEAERFQRTGQSNEIYCFELFRRALVDQEEVAWQAVHDQYYLLVTKWVHNYSRFAQTGEEAAFFVNGAFFRMWKRFAGSGRPDTFEGVGKCLEYLKLCACVTIEDFMRRKKKDALATAVTLKHQDKQDAAVHQQVEVSLIRNELRQLLAEIVQDNREQLIAQESWVYDLAPRQIQARHPETFATVTEVSRIKRNIIKRLKRHPKLKKLRDIWPKS